MPKNIGKTKNTETSFGLRTVFSSEKYLFISIKFKIHTSQLIVKILLKQQSLNQIRYCLPGHIKI